jgi:N-acetylmuramic acid 6-phosphate etherase
MDLARLPTERARADLADLDLRPVSAVVELMIDEERGVHEALAAAAPAITAALETIIDRLTRGGRMVYVGAGTAGRLGLLDAAECVPTFNTDRVVALLAGGAEAFVSPREGAEDDPAEACAALAELPVDADDVVVGIAASGRTPYTVAALEAAGNAGAATVAIVANPGTPLARVADHAIEVLTGPEVVAGSTRLKAGTAQKLVLNILSTVAMVTLGKTYGNLMVDLRSTNAKLRDRARRIVAEAAGVDVALAAAALERAGGEVKTAIVTLLTGLDVDTARRTLDAASGRVRTAVDGQAR